MSKLQFKSMLKECLSELINEGAFDNKIEQITESKMKKGGGFANSSPSTKVEEIANQNLAQTIRNLSEGSNVGGVSKGMFAELLMDTATNTLQNQLREEKDANGMFLGGDGISAEQAMTDINQLEMLAGGDISRWAKSAFSKKPK